MTNQENPTDQPEYRDVTRARLRDISLRYDPDKPDGIPAELNDLWEELADEADRVSRRRPDGPADGRQAARRRI